MDRPLLLDVHRGVLLHVRNVPETGRMSELRGLYLPTLLNHLRKGMNMCLIVSAGELLLR